MCPKKIQYKYVKVDNDNELEQQEEIAVIDLEETTMKRKFLTPRCLWTSGFTGLLLACYYVPSITLTFYQRWFLQVIYGHTWLPHTYLFHFADVQIARHHGTCTYGSQIHTCLIDKNHTYEETDEFSQSRRILDGIPKSRHSSRFLQRY